MVGGVSYAAGKRAAANREAEAAQAAPPPAAQAPPPAASAAPTSEADRIDALTKLKNLLDSGVLTEEQYEAEKQKLLQGN